MITKGGKEITAAYVGKRALSALYAGARLVWSAQAAASDLAIERRRAVERIGRMEQ